MTTEKFFELFLEELRLHPSMQSYYKFLADPKKLLFRKQYFLSRLRYIERHIGNPGRLIWDVGCGYATTAIYLALNGFRVHGSTLEFYYKEIPQRLQYWSQFGSLDQLTVAYEDIYDKTALPDAPTVIIVQDTLHHLEPIKDALEYFHKTLAPGGRVIAVEENGQNLMQRIYLYLKRGNNRVMTVRNEITGRDVLMGNENIRTLEQWNELFAEHRFNVYDVEYVRYYLPMFWNSRNADKRIAAEQEMWKNNGLRRRYFYFGINFIAEKQSQNIQLDRPS